MDQRPKLRLAISDSQGGTRYFDPGVAWRHPVAYVRAFLATALYAARFHDSTRRRIAFLLGLLCAVSFAALVIMAVAVGLRLWLIPKWYLESRRTVGLGQAVNEYRASVTPVLSALVQSCGGLLIIAAWRQFMLSRRQQQEQDFRTAVDQLASQSMALRVLALHTLEMMARRDPLRQLTVAHLISAFVHEQVPRHKGGDPVTVDFATAISMCGRLELSIPPVPKYRLVRGNEPYRENLSFAGADLSGLDLRSCTFANLNLAGANFTTCNLAGVVFDGCTLAGARFHRSRCVGTTFSGTNMPRCDFFDADLTDAKFLYSAVMETKFTQALVRRTRFDGSALLFAKFHGAIVDAAVLNGYDTNTASFLGARLINLDLTDSIDAPRTPALRAYVKKFGGGPHASGEEITWTEPSFGDPGYGTGGASKT